MKALYVAPEVQSKVVRAPMPTHLRTIAPAVGAMWFVCFLLAYTLAGRQASLWLVIGTGFLAIALVWLVKSRGSDT